jgi:hypothetical protein
MYKMYFTKDAAFKDKLKELNSQTSKLVVEKDVFTVF